MTLEVTSFEVTELSKIVERNIIDGTDLFPDGSVEVKDSRVSTRVDGSEVRRNVVVVFIKLGLAMRENEFCSLENTSPCDNPISVSFHSFCGLGGSEMKFEVADIFDSPIVCDGGVHAREDNVNIDRLASEDVIPLRVREFWYPFRSEDHPLGTFNVK
jgi:hypothetical protein